MVVEQPAYPGWDDLVAMLNPAYMVGQLERGENGTLHWQFAIQWSLPLLRCYQEGLASGTLRGGPVMGGSRQYCQKEDSRDSGPWEYGNRPTGGFGKAQAEDWDTWYTLASEGALRDSAKIQIKHLGNLERIHRQNLKFIDQTDVRGVWIWGKPGVGKSHFARQVLGAEGTT